MPIQVIKAKATTTPAQSKAAIRRVAAYCRVSTDSDEQESSYLVQCEHYKNYISSHDGWMLAGIYADEGISGTQTKNRTEFNRMVADCEKGLIDMVITKSISRWARNTVDSLNNIRKLKELGIPVYFEKESINTMDARGEVLITIMSSLAQQESESISKNVRMGIHYHMQQGKRNFVQGHLYGYRKDGSIVPEEAEIVRKIYRGYLDGYSTGMLARKLTDDGVRSPGGKKQWHASTIKVILKNEKYCGDFLMQKTFVEDFLTHKTSKNTGQLPQYFVQDDHDPIVPREVSFQVQGEIQRRLALKTDPTKLRFGSTLAFSGRLFCGICGRDLKRYTSEDPDKIDWRCRDRGYNKTENYREKNAICPCRIVKEKEVERAVVWALNSLPGIRDELVRQMGVLGASGGLDRQIDSLKEQAGRLEERMNGLPEGGEREFLSGEVKRLEEERNALVLERAETANKTVHTRLLLELADGLSDGFKERADGGDSCADYEEFFRRTRYVPEEGVIGEDGKIKEFSNDMVIRYLDRITVTESGYEVNFKAGIVVNVGLDDLKA